MPPRSSAHPVVASLHSCAASTDRKSTRLNSSHVAISYAVFCLKKKNKTADASSASMINAVFENQKELTKMQLYNQKKIAKMKNDTQKEIEGIQSETSRQNQKDQ